MSKKIPLIIVAGPTGIGKSSLGLEIAKKLNTPLISADSRQIYLDFDIGTAKPTKEEQESVKHYMIDVCEPTRNFTVAEYVEMVKEIIDDIYNQNKIPLLVGGTGLYIKTLIENYSLPKVEPLYDLRESLKKEAEEKGNRYIYEKALQIDPVATGKLHENDLIRVIRVIEVYEALGQKLSELQKKDIESPYDLTYIGVDLEREKLYERIGIRVEQMFKDGLLDEVKHIIDKYGIDLPLLNTINYKEPREYILKKISLEETKELMKKNTRNFAKRQVTWFRHDPNLKWYKIETKNDFVNILNFVTAKF